ncbi:NUDIX hydrolase [uncultured Friedmanniella sp.]|uniref:NUDIX hydrolase n=1 Tax=uncultured Friedmanniella sp. TaxID=335381 RepID=UPI0035C956E1
MTADDTVAAARPVWLDPLVAALASPDRVRQVVAVRPGVGGRAAAVLVLIGEGERGPEILFVERAATLRTHAGQIAFPGGAADAGDVDLVDTALREAEEEVGVERSGVEILGLLPAAHVAVSGFDVTAVIGWWREPGLARAVDAREVASVPVVAVVDLTDPTRRASVAHPSGYTGPAFEVHGHLIWGLTAHLLDGVLDLARWQRPWDAFRRVPIPARYLTAHPDAAGPDPGGPDAH